MSNNEEGVKMVRIAAAEIEKLCPQVSKFLISMHFSIKFLFLVCFSDLI